MFQEYHNLSGHLIGGDTKIPQLTLKTMMIDAFNTHLPLLNILKE